MREPKPRAWSKSHSAYCDFVTLDKTGAWIGWFKRCGIYLADNDIVVEFPTGLKDKNGKEVYEGDIVETLINGVWTTGNHDVIFSKKLWKLEAIWADGQCGFLWRVIGSKNQPNRVYDILDQHLGAFEVIGNIHENRDLLEEEE